MSNEHAETPGTPSQSAPPSDAYKWAKKAKKESYSAMEETVELGASGHLKATYILVTGPSTRPPEDCGCKMGINEEGAYETSFEPDDEARFVLTLHNCSEMRLTHVYATSITIHGVDCSNPGVRGDGLSELEIAPDDRYFGTIEANGSVTRELALVSRGVAPGNYTVNFHFTYDIEGCPVDVPLPICVAGD